MPEASDHDHVGHFLDLVAGPQLGDQAAGRKPVPAIAAAPTTTQRDTSAICWTER